MAETSTDPAPDHAGAAYPKPAGWEYMTHEERYAALRSEPKPDSEYLQKALAQAKQDVLRDERDERKAITEARQITVLADAPHFTISLTAPPTLSLAQGIYPIAAILTYTSDPASTTFTTQAARPVLFRPCYGPLSPSAPNENLYSVYTTPTCTPECRIPHVRPNASIRPPREADGSFTKELEVTSWDGWEEAHPGDTVRKEVAMGLDERSGWSKHLETGKSYWLRCDDAGFLGVGRLGLDRYWRYGDKDSMELPMKIKLRDPEAVSIPLEPSNVVEFQVVQ